jgi:hypothetical protein
VDGPSVGRLFHFQIGTKRANWAGLAMSLKEVDRKGLAEGDDMERTARSGDVARLRSHQLPFGACESSPPRSPYHRLLADADVRDAIPKVQELATAEFVTLRLRLLQIAAGRPTNLAASARHCVTHVDDGRIRIDLLSGE